MRPPSEADHTLLSPLHGFKCRVNYWDVTEDFGKAWAFDWKLSLCHLFPRVLENIDFKLSPCLQCLLIRLCPCKTLNSGGRGCHSGRETWLIQDTHLAWCKTCSQEFWKLGFKTLNLHDGEAVITQGEKSETFDTHMALTCGWRTHGIIHNCGITVKDGNGVIQLIWRVKRMTQCMRGAKQ